MKRDDEILVLEQGFWRASFAGDGAYYAEHLADDGLLVFPEPTGVLDKATCVEIIGGSPASPVEWSLSDVRVVPLGESAAALIYRGSATREGASPSERDRRTSVYRLEGGRWRLAVHHVTPEGEA